MRAYCKEAYKDPVGMYVNLTEASRAHPRNSPILITFMEDKAKRIHHPYFDVLVVNLEIERHKFKRNLIDNRSSDDIIFARTLSQMNILDKTFWPVKNNLCDFVGNEVIHLGQITLKVTFGTFQNV